MRAARVMAIALVAAAAVAGAVVSVALGRGEPGEADRLAILLVVVTYVVVAVVILGARPGNAVGRLLLAGACAWGVGEGLLAVGVEGADPGSVSAPVPTVVPTLVLVGVLGIAARGLGWLVLALWVPLVFPDGRTAWPGRRAPVVLVAAAVGTFTLATLLSPTPLESRLEDLANPIGLPDDWRLLTDLMAIGALALAVASLGVAVAGLVRRWRGGDEMVHQQLLWFAAAFACPLLLLPLVATPGAAPWMFAMVSLPVPVAVGVALLQRRLYDIQLVVSRTLTYLLLSAAVAALYALTVGGVGVLLRERGAPWLPWVAAGVVAVSFAPLRNALQQMVTRLTYGQWSEPAAVLAASGRRLADAADVPALLRSLVAELGEGLGLERVEILDAHGRTLARHGAAPRAGSAAAEGVAGSAAAEGVAGSAAAGVELQGSAVAAGVELPLLAYGVRVGVLRHSPRRLRAADRELLADVARQLGGVVHSAALLETIREGQERLVLAREEERRRLRRDLHDGLGPALAALTLQVDTLRNRLASAGVAAGVAAGVPAGPPVRTPPRRSGRGSAWATGCRPSTSRPSCCGSAAGSSRRCGTSGGSSRAFARRPWTSTVSTAPFDSWRNTSRWRRGWPPRSRWR